MSEPSWPDANTAANLYGRLRGGDPVAVAEFAAAFLNPLVADLKTVCPHVNDDHLRIEAAEDALLAMIRNPDLFNPTRSDLPAFLRMAARSDLSNALARERRHHRNREEQNCVELEMEDGNYSGDVDTDLPSFDDLELADVVAAMPDPERQVLDLMRAGVRRTEAFAAVLGIADRPLGEQQREVKRAKDRIMKRLRRAGGGS